MGDKPHINQTDLDAGLTRLGIRELQERMEISPLLLTGAPEEVDEADTICCVCKIPGEDYIGKDGMLPYPMIQDQLLGTNPPADSVTWLR